MVLNPFEVLEKRLQNIEDMLIDLRHNPPIQTKAESEAEKPLTIAQAAEYLSLSPQTIYTLISKGELPVNKRSKRCYFFAADLNEYLKAGSKKSKEHIKDAAEKHLKRLNAKK